MEQTTDFYLEVGAIQRLSTQLNDLDNPDRDFKLSNCLALANFILNVIKYRYLERNPPTLKSRLDSTRLNAELKNQFFIEFSFLKPDGLEERLDDPTLYQVLNWSRNRITHYRNDLPDNTPPPWPRGIQIQGRGPGGIRTFTMSGPTSIGQNPIISARTDRRMFTAMVQFFVSEYIAALHDAGIDTSVSLTVSRTESAEIGS